MRMPEQEQCIQGACPTEEEMDKEMELMLVEKYGLGQIALKIWKDGFEQGKKEGYDEGYDKGYDNGRYACENGEDDCSEDYE